MIEIRELVIEARVTETAHSVSGNTLLSGSPLKRMEQEERFINTILRRVLERLREKQEEM